MQLKSSEYRSRGAKKVPRASAQKPGEREAELARGHVEAARSCAVPERASVGDAKALEADVVPPEADTGQIRVTMGQRS